MLLQRTTGTTPWRWGAALRCAAVPRPDLVTAVCSETDRTAYAKLSTIAPPAGRTGTGKTGEASYLLDSEGPAAGAAMSQSTLLPLPDAADESVRSVDQ